MKPHEKAPAGGEGKKDRTPKSYTVQEEQDKADALVFLAALPGRLRWIRNSETHVLEIGGRCFRVDESDLLESIRVFCLARQLGPAVESFQILALEVKL